MILVLKWFNLARSHCTQHYLSTIHDDLVQIKGRPSSHGSLKWRKLHFNAAAAVVVVVLGALAAATTTEATTTTTTTPTVITTTTNGRALFQSLAAYRNTLK